MASAAGWPRDTYDITTDTCDPVRSCSIRPPQSGSFPNKRLGPNVTSRLTAVEGSSSSMDTEGSSAHHGADVGETHSVGLKHRASPYAGLVWPFLGVTGCLTMASLPFLVVPWLPRRIFGALPYMNTPKPKIEYLFKTLLPRVRGFLPTNARPPRFIDLGSGAGEAVLEAARCGYIAHGVELNPTLYMVSRYNAWRSRLEKPSVSFSMGNMWSRHLGSYDVVCIFGVQSLMARLVSKLHDEAKDGAVVVSYRFELPIEPSDDTLTLVENEQELLVYRVRRRKEALAVSAQPKHVLQ